MAKWACSKCNYVHIGYKPPWRCPDCHTTNFIEIKETVKSRPVGVTNSNNSIKQEAEIKQSSKNIVGNVQSNKPIMQGVSVVSTNVVSEQDIARAVQETVNKEIAKLNAQGKRVLNVSVGSAVKNVIGMKHHIVILWEKS